MEAWLDRSGHYVSGLRLRHLFGSERENQCSGPREYDAINQPVHLGPTPTGISRHRFRLGK